MADNENSARLDGDMLVGLSAVVIGLAALGVSLYEARLMRTEQRASVLPIIEMGVSFRRASDANDGLIFAMFVENVGTGPARIRDVRLRVDGAPTRNWGDVLDRVDWPEGVARGYTQSQISGKTLPSERRVDVFELEGEPAVAFFQQRSRFETEICYCSIFDECWVVSTDDRRQPSPVEICASDEASFEQ